ncbi:MAG: hypothetical protein JSW67_01905, partial [Candidatus Latescibacterota bacterium]
MSLRSACVLLLLLPLFGCALFSFGGAPAFDFSDQFYRSHGIEPQEIVGRLRAQDVRSILDHPPSAEFADVRI